MNLRLPVRKLFWVFAVSVLWLGAGCEQPLQHDLDEREANAMVVTLTEQGFEAQKVRDPGDGERWAVVVPRQERVQAWSVLQREGFPRPELGGFGDFYPGGGLIPTAKEERVVLQYATAKQLRTSLLHVDGIVDAHVHLVMPEKPRVQMGDGSDGQPRASVLVQWSERVGQPPLNEEEIRQLVGGAVENLDPQAVHVVMNSVASAQPAAQRPEYSRVGPIAVAPQSRNLLRGFVLLMGAVIIALSSALVYLVVKRRREPPGGGLA